MDVLDIEFLERVRRETERAWVRGDAWWRPGTRWTSDCDVDSSNCGSARGFPRSTERSSRYYMQPRFPVAATCSRTTGPRRWICPGFYHWERDIDAIAEARTQVVRGWVFDVENNTLWPASWGRRPDYADARAARVAELVAGAPTLFPIFGHRFVVGGTAGLVLSIHQSDIIVYGANLREYLTDELATVLDGDHRFHQSDVDRTKIPFWGELIG